MLRPLVALALLVAGCGGDAHWSLPLSALDRIPLSVAQRGSDEVWLAGGPLGSPGDALLLRYDGKAWRALAAGTSATLWWLFAPPAAPAWAVGEKGTVLRIDGDVADAEPVPTSATLFGVWGTAADNLWVVGGVPDDSGVVLHRDAAGWHDLTPPAATGAFFKVWGAAADDVYICGQLGALWHWDGAALSSVAPAGLGRAPLLTVAGKGGSDVFAVGGLGNAVVLHFDGTSWSRLSDPLFDSAPGLAGVAVDAHDGTAWLVGAGGFELRGRPGAWHDETAAATRADLHAVSVADGSVFAVGGNYFAPAGAARTGVVAHFGGDISSTIR
jgi:hypothetical protein